jgi:hypothetical protein
MQFVRTLNDFPDGFNFTIPILGEAEVATFNEGQALNIIRWIRALSCSTSLIISTLLMPCPRSSNVIHGFRLRFSLPSRSASIARSWNTMRLGCSLLRTLDRPLPRLMPLTVRRIVGLQRALPRRSASADFAKARYALTKSNVPMRNLVAIVDPSTAYTIETQTQRHESAFARSVNGSR